MRLNKSKKCDESDEERETAEEGRRRGGKGNEWMCASSQD